MRPKNSREAGVVHGIADKMLVDKKLKDYRKAVYNNATAKRHAAHNKKVASDARRRYGAGPD